MMIRHFSLNKATSTVAVQSDDHRPHCTIRSKASLTFALVRKYQVSAVCCHMLPESWAEDHGLALLESRRRDIWYVPRRKSRGDLGRVSEQARKKYHRAEKTAFKYSRACMLKWAGASSCMNYILRRTCSGTSTSNSGNDCSKKSL
jgi:hypothetical protein